MDVTTDLNHTNSIYSYMGCKVLSFPVNFKLPLTTILLKILLLNLVPTGVASEVIQQLIIGAFNFKVCLTAGDLIVGG